MFVFNSVTTTMLFSIPIIDDEQTEQTEAFTLGVTLLREGLNVILPERAVVIIEDNDQPIGSR